MKWCPLYNATQSWAEPSINSLRENMRSVVINEKDHVSKILNAQRIKEVISEKRFIKTIEKEFC